MLLEPLQLFTSVFFCLLRVLFKWLPLLIFSPFILYSLLNNYFRFFLFLLFFLHSHLCPVLKITQAFAYPLLVLPVPAYQYCALPSVNFAFSFSLQYFKLSAIYMLFHRWTTKWTKQFNTVLTDSQKLEFQIKIEIEQTQILNFGKNIKIS